MYTINFDTIRAKPPPDPGPGELNPGNAGNNLLKSTTSPCQAIGTRHLCILCLISCQIVDLFHTYDVKHEYIYWPTVLYYSKRLQVAPDDI